MTHRITGARYLAETLKSYGVTHLFYVEAMLRKAMVEAEELGIRRIVTHSEKAAAYMADGYARTARRVGVCMAQSVGAANLAAGLQDPYLASSPVLALTGKKPPMWQHRNSYQEIAHGPMFDAVTKFNADVVDPQQLPLLLRQAFREAVSGRPRPVHLDLVGREARELELGSLDAPPGIDEQFAICPPFRPAPDPGSIEQAAKAISGSERPIIVAGGGVRVSGASKSLLALAQKSRIPVATSVDGKGLIPDMHPLSAGVVGSYSAWCANRAVAASDLVIYVGSATGDQVTHNWKVPCLGTKVVQIDIDPVELGRNYPDTVGVLGDATVCLDHLIRALEPVEDRPEWLRYVHELVEQWRSVTEPFRLSDETPIRPERICREIGELLADDAIVVTDTGYSSIWAATMLHMRSTEQTFIRAAGSLGWGFPASLGAKCAAPKRPVVCFTGDGGFWYHFAELETARRHNIHTLTIVNNNSGLSQGIDDVLSAYAQRPGNPAELYRFESVSFAKIAEDIGCVGIRVQNPAELGPAIERALKIEAPVVLEVVTDFSARTPAPWAPA